MSLSAVLLSASLASCITIHVGPSFFTFFFLAGSPSVLFGVGYILKCLENSFLDESLNILMDIAKDPCY